jgi:arylformamidase
VSSLIDLSHPLVAGHQPYAWLPAPRISEFLSRAESRRRYAAGTEFVIHQIELIGNSGTYIDSPFHRHADGNDLADLPLARVANLPGIVITMTQQERRPIEPGDIDVAEADLRGSAMLFHTSWDRKWGQAEYPSGSPFISRATAQVLVDGGVALVGIDALNVDDTDDPVRPAHTLLLDAGIPIVENLCRLEQLPPNGFRFFAAPAPVQECGSFPVRAFAML